MRILLQYQLNPSTQIFFGMVVLTGTWSGPSGNADMTHYNYIVHRVVKPTQVSWHGTTEKLTDEKKLFKDVLRTLILLYRICYT